MGAHAQRRGSRRPLRRRIRADIERHGDPSFGSNADGYRDWDAHDHTYFPTTTNSNDNLDSNTKYHRNAHDRADGDADAMDGDARVLALRQRRRDYHRGQQR